MPTGANRYCKVCRKALGVRRKYDAAYHPECRAVLAALARAHAPRPKAPDRPRRTAVFHGDRSLLGGL